MLMSTYVRQWSITALIGMTTAMSCGDTVPGEFPMARDASTTARDPLPNKASMTPELRAAYIAAVQNDAGETYRAEREVSGAARFVHPTQAFDATIDGTEMRFGPVQARTWEISLSMTGIGCEGNLGFGAQGAVGDPIPQMFNQGVGLSPGAVNLEGNRVEIKRPNVREWYVNGPLGLEQGFTLERAPSCEGTKVVTMDVGGSGVAQLVDEDGDGRGEAITFVDAEGVSLARYTDLYVKDANGKRLDAWMSVTAGRIALHVDDVGAVYPVQIDPLVWGQQAKLFASDGDWFTGFGYSVAVSGDTAVVGGSDQFGKKIDQQAPYVFIRNGGIWTQQARLTPSDHFASHYFAYSVALSGDTALVGRYDQFGVRQGSAFVFTRSAVLWTEQAKLTASDGVPGDGVGRSVALSGDTALVGAAHRSTVYVFTRSGVLWTEQAQLTDGPNDNAMGASVALSGDTALVGSRYSTNGQGAAHVFTRNGVVWTKQAVLTASDGAMNDNFGMSVALSGDTALVGAGFADVGANDVQGSAYLFTRNGTSWNQQQKLTASDGVTGDTFGFSVALLGDTAVVGAIQSNSVGPNFPPGAAYVFTRSGVLWTEERKLTASDGDAEDRFGYSVALSGDTMLVGANNDEIGLNTGQGSVYVFGLVKSDGESCASNAECFGGFCVDGICCNAACGAVVNGACMPLAMGTVCRASVSACDVIDTCDGAATDCPVDTVVVTGIECRAAAGVCDVAEFCDGVEAECPTDAFIEVLKECRTAAGVCDVAEFCDGVQADCPHDERIPYGTICQDNNVTEGTCTDGGCIDVGTRGPLFNEGDCICRAAGTSSGGTSSAALFLFGIAFLVTRRRQRANRV